MAAIVEKELFESRSFIRTENGYEASKRYLVSGATDEYDAANADGLPAWNTAYGATAPAAFMAVKNIRCNPITDSPGKFTVDVKWAWNFNRPSGGNSSPSDGTEVWSIDGTGQTVNVDACLSQTKYGDDARDVGVAVGQDVAGEIHGADIFETTVTLTVKLWKTTADVNQSYLAGCIQALQKVNSVTWYGLQPGECLFNRFSVSKSEDLVTEINFEFLGRPNLDSDEIPAFKDKDDNPISVASGKEGWQYLWAMPGQKKDGSKTKTWTMGVYVSDFYESDSFSALGLSGSLTGEPVGS